MYKYYIDEEDPYCSDEKKKLIKTHFIRKREFTPFHLDCQYSKKKICYCKSHPIA
jgi:hypothetical protein